MQCTASDACHVSACVEGTCQETAVAGFVDDGFSSELPGDNILRTTTVAAGDYFYVATYGTFDKRRDIVLNVFAKDVNEEDAAASTLEFRLAALFPNNVIASPAAIAVDNKYVNVYFATRPMSALPEAAGQMQRVRFALFDIGKGMLQHTDSANLTNSPNFRGSDYLGPAAGLVGQIPFVVWPGCATIGATTDCVTTNNESHGVYVQAGAEFVNLDPTNGDAVFFHEDVRLAGLVALGGGGQIGAAWMVRESGKGEITVRTAFLSDDGTPKDPDELVQCIQQDEPQGNALASAANADGSLRVLGWSQQSLNSGEYATQLETLTCEGSVCTGSDPECEDTDRLLDGAGTRDAASNVDVAWVVPPGDPGEYFARATVTNSESNATASAVELVLSRLPGADTSSADAGSADAGSTDASSADAGVSGWNSAPKVLSSNESSNASADWPSVAANGDVVLVAWRESVAGGWVRRLVRQRACFPTRP
jgi:hypothetical protein